MSERSTSPRLVVGEYELDDCIGEGGCAFVHVARKRGVPGFSPFVAVKRLKPALADDRDAVTALVEEARISSRVHHPNVVRTLDVVTDGSDVLLVLELVVGAPLSRLMSRAKKQGKRVPPPVACAVVAGMLRGLAAAHEAREGGELLGLVHRDVSPENVLVDEHGTSKLSDFGIAKARGRLLATAPDVIKGKLRYMAPEYLRGDPIDARADVHAAGVVLWEALTGRAAFADIAGDDAAIVRAVCAGDLAPPSTLADVPGALDRIITKSVTRAPAERYGSARAMLEELESIAPLASSEEVARWVSETAPDELAKLRAAVSVLERDATVIDLVVGGGRREHVSVVPRRDAWPGRHRVLLLAAAIPIAALLVFALMRERDQGGPSGAEPLGASASRTSPRADVTSELGPVDVAPSAMSSANATAVAPHAAGGRPGTRVRTRGKACEPPWTVDEKGIKHYKDECL
jgi:serine/threonine protein kinase